MILFVSWWKLFWSCLNPNFFLLKRIILKLTSTKCTLMCYFHFISSSCVATTSLTWQNMRFRCCYNRPGLIRIKILIDIRCIWHSSLLLSSKIFISLVFCCTSYVLVKRNLLCSWQIVYSDLFAYNKVFIFCVAGLWIYCCSVHWRYCFGWFICFNRCCCGRCMSLSSNWGHICLSSFLVLLLYKNHLFSWNRSA